MIKIISYDEQRTFQNKFFIKRLKIKQNTAKIGADF